MALLEARGLIKIFGKLTALNGADLTVAENEFHGLIGPNGSGKSTLMKCVAGAEIPTSGTVIFGGHDIAQASPADARPRRHGPEVPDHQRAAGIDVVRQHSAGAAGADVASQSGVLAHPRDPARPRHGDARTIPSGAIAPADPASALSHGQQQWLEIAMALAPEPKLLLLDEPTGGMSLEEGALPANCCSRSRTLLPRHRRA